MNQVYKAISIVLGGYVHVEVSKSGSLHLNESLVVLE